MNPKPRISTAGLCGVYNYTDDDSTFASLQSFAISMVDGGSVFMAFDGNGYRELSERDKISGHFTAFKKSRWVGRLTIPSQQFVSILRHYLGLLSTLNVETADRSKWMNTVERYGDLSVTIDFAGRETDAYTLITYWTNTGKSVENLRFRMQELTFQDVAKVLIDDLYLDIDNFFSEYLQVAWHLSFTPGQLRKPAFIYFIGIDDGMDDKPTKITSIEHMDSLLFQTLLSDRTDVEGRLLSPHLAVFFSKGFIGMTGQPNLKQAPTLYLLIMDNRVDDPAATKVLHTFSEVEKLCAKVRESGLGSISSQMVYSEFASPVETPSASVSTFDHSSLVERIMMHPRLVEVIGSRRFKLSDSLPVLSLPVEASKSLLDGLLSIQTSPYLDEERFLQESRVVFGNVGSGVLDWVEDYKSTASFPGVLLIRNLPRDPNLPITPPDGRRSSLKKTFVSEACLAGIGQMLGQPFSFREEKEGELFHNICPVKAKSHSHSNAGYAEELGFHTEDAHRQDRPDHLLLYCLRDDPAGKAVTTIADVYDVMKELDFETTRVLADAPFVIKAPESFGEKNELAKTPLLLSQNGYPELRLNFDRMTATDDAGQHAIVKLAEAIQRVKKEIHVSPGDLLLINNKKAIHGRSVFEARFDGTDRWLQRLYVATDLWKLPTDPPYPMRRRGD